MRFNLKQTAALTAAAAGGAAMSALALRLMGGGATTTTDEDDSNFSVFDLRADDMVSIRFDDEEIINVWINHENKIAAEFVRSNVEIKESFERSTHGRERAEFSTLALRMEHYNRMDDTYEGLFDDEDQFIPLDGFDDDPWAIVNRDYDREFEYEDHDADLERWFEEHKDMV